MRESQEVQKDKLMNPKMHLKSNLGILSLDDVSLATYKLLFDFLNVKVTLVEYHILLSLTEKVTLGQNRYVC